VDALANMERSQFVDYIVFLVPPNFIREFVVFDNSEEFSLQFNHVSLLTKKNTSLKKSFCLL
jgi:hypothetical protein